jgi:hypothetical protein
MPAKVPNKPPKYQKHAPTLAKLPRIPPKYPNGIFDVGIIRVFLPRGCSRRRRTSRCARWRRPRATPRTASRWGGRCTLTPPDPQLKGAWFPGGFNPCVYRVRTRFQNVAFKCNLRRYAEYAHLIQWGQDRPGAGRLLYTVDFRLELVANQRNPLRHTALCVRCVALCH